jgi:hypothetical protein
MKKADTQMMRSLNLAGCSAMQGRLAKQIGIPARVRNTEYQSS